MKTVSRKLTYTILSISLLTVMAGAAIAPALGVIRNHFADASDLLVQFIVSLPALFIIVTNLCFGALCRHFGTKTIALAGLVLYVLAGAGAFFVDSIGILLILRALLGISVGMIMPLSTGLLSFYFPPEEQASLMGLAAAMNQLGGVVATLLAGLLAQMRWNYAFLVYLLGLIAIVMVVLFLPNEHIESKGRVSLGLLKRFHPSVIGMLLLMILFFIYPTNFAIAADGMTTLSGTWVTVIMVGLDLIAFFVGLGFGAIMGKSPKAIKYIAPIGFLIGYLTMSVMPGAMALIVGSVFIGIANGIGVPYLNTIASLKAGKEAATTVMPLLSAALYLGQFVSPLIVLPMGKALFGESNPTAPFAVGVIISVIFLGQMFLTRKRQVIS